MRTARVAGVPTGHVGLEALMMLLKLIFSFGAPFFSFLLLRQRSSVCKPPASELCNDAVAAACTIGTVGRGHTQCTCRPGKSSSGIQSPGSPTQRIWNSIPGSQELHADSELTNLKVRRYHGAYGLLLFPGITKRAGRQGWGICKL